MPFIKFVLAPVPLSIAECPANAVTHSTTTKHTHLASIIVNRFGSTFLRIIPLQYSRCVQKRPHVCSSRREYDVAWLLVTAVTAIYQQVFRSHFTLTHTRALKFVLPYNGRGKKKQCGRALWLRILFHMHAFAFTPMMCNSRYGGLTFMISWAKRNSIFSTPYAIKTSEANRGIESKVLRRVWINGGWTTTIYFHFSRIQFNTFAAFSFRNIFVPIFLRPFRKSDRHMRDRVNFIADQN